MLRTTFFAVAGLVIGFALASWNDGGAPFAGGVSADARERLDALEAALRDEQSRRLDLEAKLAEIAALVGASAVVADGARPSRARAPLQGASAPGESAPGEAPFSPDSGAAAAPRAEPDFGSRAAFARDDGLVQRFVAAGISADRAQWIVRRTEELRMEALQAQYEAARSGEPLQERLPLSGGDALHAELGDADYERYLQALGRPTSVYVRGVLATSPGAQAGLQSGDEIIAYAGTRVFGMGDLNRLVLEGAPGRTVTVDVLRDGQPMQVYVPSGPIGITGGGRRSGRR